MKIFVDIDETICFYEGDRNYPDAKPNLENIKKINTLYEKGNEITYWTARGSMTGIDWYEITRDQRSEERRVGKECRSRWSPHH